MKTIEELVFYALDNDVEICFSKKDQGVSVYLALFRIDTDDYEELYINLNEIDEESLSNIKEEVDKLRKLVEKEVN